MTEGTTTPSMAERVRAGVQLLDACNSPDWRDRINIVRLDLSDVSMCVLGQVYGSYGLGVRRLHLEATDEFAYGFHAQVPRRGSSIPSARIWPLLTEAWKQALRE